MRKKMKKMKIIVIYKKKHRKKIMEINKTNQKIIKKK